MTPNRRRRSRLLALAAAAQAACGVLLAIDILSELAELASDPAHAVLEVAIVATLLLGSALIGAEFRRLRAESNEMQARIRAASGAFVGVLEDAFDQWGLTHAEREVALLAIKGFTTDEIAGLRDARAGTIRAQCAAVYRKAGVSGRAQLLSLFVDHLLGGANLMAARPASRA